MILAAARTETSLGGTDWGMLQAGVTISIVPCILVYVLLQKYYVSGLTQRGGQVTAETTSAREHRARQLEAWFVTGSQHLYGEAVLERVDEHARQIAGCLDEAAAVPVRIVAKPVVTTPEAIAAVLREADAAPDCVGVIAWMHTFSPGQDVDRRPDATCASRSSTSTPSTTAICPGPTSTWTS